MSKYIELDKALEKAQLACIIALCDENPDDYEDVDFSDEFAVSVNDLCELPAADVVERKRGEWERVQGDIHSSGYPVRCTECGKYHFVHYRGSLGGLYAHDELFTEPSLCPNCGADMRGEKHEAD